MKSDGSSLTGRLLVAPPALADSNFDRAVVLILSHDDDGALGVVVNKPSEVPVDDVLPGWSTLVSRPDVVFQGGPVSLDSALGLVSIDDGDEPLGVRRVRDRLGVVDLDTPTEIVQPAISAMRVFAGYAGWAPGQLEAEIEDDAWYVLDAELADAFRPDAEGLWAAVLRRQSGPLALVASFPRDLSLN